MLLEVAPLLGSRETFELESASWSQKEQGGWHEGAFTLKSLPDHIRRELSGARLTLHGPNRPVFFGKAIGAQGDTIRAQGWYHDLAETEAAGVYSSKTLTDWREMRSDARNTAIETHEEFGYLRFIFRAGTTYPQYAHTGVVFDLPHSVTSATLTFTWTRYNQTDYYYDIYTGVYNASSTDGDSYTWTQRGAQGVGSGGTSGNATVTLSGIGSFDAVRILAVTAVSVTPGADTAYKVSALRLTTGGLTAPVKASAVMGAILDRLPTQPLRDITASTDDVTDFRVEAGSTALDATSALLAMQDFQFAGRARLAAGVWQAAATFAPRPTTPAYTLAHDGTSVVAALEPVDWTQLASRVLVRYRTIDGRPLSVWVSDTDPTHYLVARGIVKDAVIDVDTTSATVAATAGAAYLAKIGGVEPVTGTITVTGEVGGVLPCDMEAGNLVAVSVEGRTHTARIREIAHTGAHKAVLTVNNTPTLEDVLRGIRK